MFKNLPLCLEQFFLNHYRSLPVFKAKQLQKLMTHPKAQQRAIYKCKWPLHRKFLVQIAAKQ